MEQGRKKEEAVPGRFLIPSHGRKMQRTGLGRWITVSVLLAWDGLLLYMIVCSLIEPVYGAAFVAVVSVYLGYQL